MTPPTHVSIPSISSLSIEKFRSLDFISSTCLINHIYSSRTRHADILSSTASKAFECTITGPEGITMVANQGCAFRANIDYDEALKKLANYDVMIVPGTPLYADLIKENAQPLKLIKAYSELQQKNPTKERTLFSVGTASIILGHLGVLSGLSATTHPDYFVKFENVLSVANQREMAERTDVIEDRYVVNNLRFDLEDPEQSPYIRRRSDGRRPSNARKGSDAWKQSNRRESNAQARRASLKLGGLRVITAGGTSCGIDAALYLVSAMVDEASANEVVRLMQHNWTKGVVVDGLDV